jgi:uncharacterized protein (TIGR03663 family)
MHRALIILLALAALAGLGARGVGLDARPFHHDEATQAMRLADAVRDGGWRYDPVDHHGPLLPLLTWAVVVPWRGADAARWSETDLRTVTVGFGLLAALLAALALRPYGGLAAAGGAAAAAWSTGLFYFSRFYIPELALVAASAALAAAAWWWARAPSWRRALAVGAAAGLALAAKETAVLLFLAGGLAALPLRRGCDRRILARDGGVALAAAAAVCALLITGLGTHPAALIDTVRAIPVYLDRAGGGDHPQPWWLYLALIARHEWPLALLALVGAALTWRDAAARWLTVTTLLLLAMYSALSYKTPWCLATVLLLMGLLAGLGLGALARWRVWPAGLAALLLIPLGMQAWCWSVRMPAHERNGYAYVQGGNDLRVAIEARLDRLAAALGRPPVIAVVAPPDQVWPLPWHLRRFPDVGYWSDPADVPDGFIADAVLGRPDMSDKIAERVLNGEPRASYYGLRRGVLGACLCRAADMRAVTTSTSTTRESPP